MRGCLTYLLLVALFAATGYSLWQVHGLRRDVAQLQARVGAAPSPSPDSLLSTAQSALEAVRQGRVTDAGRELQRLSGQIEQAEHVASQRKVELQAQVTQARQALTRKRDEAAKQIEHLVRDLSHKVSKDVQGRPHRLAELSPVLGGLTG